VIKQTNIQSSLIAMNSCAAKMPNFIVYIIKRG